MKLVLLFIAAAFVCTSVTAQSVGTKVSINGTDGKTYTGTITEVQGTKFKIKYDVEGWLMAGQFTVIGSQETATNATTTTTTNTTNSTKNQQDNNASQQSGGFKVGDVVNVQFYSILNEATIVQAAQGKYEVRYEDKNAENEWVTADRIQAIDAGNTAGGPPAGTYICYQPIYENAYMGSFVIGANKQYTFLTGQKGTGKFQYNEEQRTIGWTGGDLAGKVIKTEYSNTKQNGPVIKLVFPKGKRVGDIQNCLLKK